MARRQTFPGRTETHGPFPEYYPIKVNQLDDMARDTLDERVFDLGA